MGGHLSEDEGCSDSDEEDDDKTDEEYLQKYNQDNGTEEEYLERNWKKKTLRIHKATRAAQDQTSPKTRPVLSERNNFNPPSPQQHIPQRPSPGVGDSPVRLAAQQKADRERLER